VASIWLYNTKQRALCRNGGDVSDVEFLFALYANALNRDPDAEGLSYWVNELQNNPLMDRSATLLSFSESEENVGKSRA
jgi:hypothetical protein